MKPFVAGLLQVERRRLNSRSCVQPLKRIEQNGFLIAHRRIEGLWGAHGAGEDLEAGEQGFETRGAPDGARDNLPNDPRSVIRRYATQAQGHAEDPSGLTGASETVAGRLGAATQELAGGVTQGASAAEELRRAMEQIAGAAEEAAGAAHESLASITGLSETFALARDRADRSQTLTVALQSQLSEAAGHIEGSVEA